MLHSEFLLSQRPGVANAREAKDWVKNLPVTDARAAHHALETLIAEFDESGIEAAGRLEILETVRTLRVEIDTQYAQRYAGKSLPLGPPERSAFEHAVSLWKRLEDTYWRIARAAAAGHAELQPRLALCLARAADLACSRLMGTLRAGQAPENAIQEAVARYAGFAREHGVLDSPASDSLHPKRFVSVASTQNRALLLGLIGGIAAGRERDCAFDLAAQWESKVTLTWLPAGLTRALTRADLPPSADPAKQKIRIVHSGGQIYFLDVTALSRSLRKRMHLLGLGTPVSELGMPASCNHTGVAALLKRLHGVWCEEQYGRRHARTAAVVNSSAAPAGQSSNLQHAVTVTFGSGDFNSIYCMLTGEPYTGNDENRPFDRLHADAMHVFQGGGHARRDHLLREAGRQIEQWRVLDQSNGGARLARKGEGGRYKTGQLAAFQSAACGGDGVATLAEVRWLSESREGVEAGVESLALAPCGIAIRLTGVNAAGTKDWVCAFRAKTANGTQCFISPAGWFKPNRVIGVKDADGKSYKWLMGGLKRRGADFEVIEGQPAA